MEQRTEEWFRARVGKATASRIADVLAKVKTGEAATRKNYKMELVVQRLTGQPGESFTNAAMEWGTATEPQARMAYEAHTGSFVEEKGFVDHPTIEWFGCSPDGVVGEGLIEIKCPNSATHWSYIKANEPPQKYIIQMQSQMSVTGAKWCDFVSFDPRMPERSQLLIVRINRDEELIAEIEKEVKQFLSEVEVEVNLMEKRNGN